MVARIAQHYDKTREQIFFLYLYNIGIIPLSGTRSRTHMMEDVDIFEPHAGHGGLDGLDVDVALTKEEIAEISSQFPSHYTKGPH